MQDGQQLGAGLQGINFGNPAIEPSQDRNPVMIGKKMFQHPPMKTSAQLLDRYGNPDVTFEGKWMTLVNIPADILKAIPVLPKKVYMNKDITAPFLKVMKALIAAGLAGDIKTWDGCFQIRKQRGASNAVSRHSWGIAFDINAAWNPLNGVVAFSQDFLNVFRQNGWICGADFTTRTDGMHFEWTAATAW